MHRPIVLTFVVLISFWDDGFAYVIKCSQNRNLSFFRSLLDTLMGLSGRKNKQRIPHDPRNLTWADGVFFCLERN